MKEIGIISKLAAASLPVKVAVGVCTGAVVLGGGTVAVVQYQHHQEAQKQLVLLNDNMSVEYGTVLSDDIADYVNVEQSDEGLVANAVVDLSGIETSEKGYAEVGEYTIKITADDKEYSISVKVEDTVGPNFKDGSGEITTPFETVPDYLSIFKAEDLSEFEITVDDSSVNYSQAGTYKITVNAKDKYGNENSLKDVSVIVSEKEETPSQGGGNSNSNTGSGSSDTGNSNTGSGSSNTGGSNTGSGSSNTGNGSSNTGGSSNAGSSGSETTTPPEEEKEPNNCPYELWTLTTYQGHFGYFWNGNEAGNEPKHTAMGLYPNGGSPPMAITVGMYDDYPDGVYFAYNDDHPDNPLK